MAIRALSTPLPEVCLGWLGLFLLPVALNIACFFAMRVFFASLSVTPSMVVHCGKAADKLVYSAISIPLTGGSLSSEPSKVCGEFGGAGTGLHALNWSGLIRGSFSAALNFGGVEFRRH